MGTLMQPTAVEIVPSVKNELSLSERFPEAEAYREKVDNNSGKISYLTSGNEVVGFVVPVLQTRKNTLVVRLDLLKHPSMDMTVIKSQVDEVIFQNREKYTNEVRKIDTVVIDLAGAAEITPKGNIDTKSVVEGMGFNPSVETPVDIVVTSWDRTPAGAPILMVEPFGKMPNEIAVGHIYHAIKKKYAFMKENGKHPGKVFDVYKIDAMDLKDSAIGGLIYRYWHVISGGMPASEFGGGLVVLHDEQSKGHSYRDFRFLLSQFIKFGYGVDSATSIDGVYKIIDTWSQGVKKN